MAKYYTLVSGLPSLTLETQKLILSREEYLSQLRDTLDEADYKLLEILRGQERNAQLVTWLSDGTISAEDSDEVELDPDGIDPEDAEALSQERRLYALKLVAGLAAQGRSRSEAIKATRELIPPYMARFVWSHFASEEALDAEAGEAEDVDGQRPALALSDQLSFLYFAEATRSGNEFVDKWMTFCQTLRNVLVVYTCRRLGWDPAGYLVGEGEVIEKLLGSRSRDFDLKDDVPLIDAMVQIAEEGDITRRERMIDALKWQWLEEETFARTFDVDNVLAYYLQLSLVERWLKLDAERGERVFRQIVMGLKSESNRSLQAFKEETKKR